MDTVACRELTGPCDPAQVAFDQRHVAGSHRHVGTRSHRDANISGGQCRRIVDAIAGHRDTAPLCLERGDEFDLVLRPHLAVKLVDPELLGDSGCGRYAVAGGHDDTDAGLAQNAQRFRCRWLDRIRHGDQPCETISHGDEHDARALRTQLLGRLDQRRHIDALLLHQHGVADGCRSARDGAPHADARAGFEVRHLLESQVARTRLGNDRLRQRVFRALVEAGRRTQNLRFREARRRL